jgi:hypothetical protein
MRDALSSAEYPRRGYYRTLGLAKLVNSVTNSTRLCLIKIAVFSSFVQEHRRSSSLRSPISVGNLSSIFLTANETVRKSSGLAQADFLGLRN